ncbi:hypothetical protein D3C71_542710 [compost metagenome]
MQRGEPVGRQQFGFLAAGSFDLGVDAAEIEQAPAQAQHAGGLAGTAAEQGAAGRGAAKQRAQAQFRVVLGDGRAGARAGGGQAPFGGDQIGPAPQQFARRAAGRDARRARHRAGGGHVIAIGAGRRAQHHVERMQRHFARRVQARHDGARLRQRRFGLP